MEDNLQIGRITTFWELCQEQLEIARKRMASLEKIIGPAELSMSERLKARLQTQSAEAENLQNSISGLQTAGSQVSRLQEMTARMSELGGLANNGTASQADRAALQEEFGQIQSAIEQMVSHESLAPGVAASLDGIGELDLSSPGTTLSSMMKLQDVSEALNEEAASFGTELRVTQQSLDGLLDSQEQLMATNGRIRNSDLARETIGLFELQAQGNVQSAMLAHSQLFSKSVLQLVR